MKCRDWDFCLMSDLAFRGNGCRKYEFKGRVWTLVIRGRVGIMLSPALCALWRQGGAQVVRGKQDRDTTRCMSVPIPCGGRRRGLSLMAVYAPVFGGATARVRGALRGRRAVERIIS